MDTSLPSCPACYAVPVEGVCACGDQQPDARSITLTDAGRGYESFRTKHRSGQRGEVAPHLEVKDDVLWNHDRQRLERRHMVIDREADHYVQRWFDLETGLPTYDKEGHLSDPEMHGESARRRKDQ